MAPARVGLCDGRAGRWLLRSGGGPPGRWGREEPLPRKLAKEKMKKRYHIKDNRGGKMYKVLFYASIYIFFAWKFGTIGS